MKILITGANGFLGQHLALYLTSRGYDVIAVSRGASRLPVAACSRYISVDLEDRDAVERLIILESPDVLIHSAANSKPDDCEINQDACLIQNVEVTRYLSASFAQLTDQSSRRFIFISTDFVFGENGPHAEDEEAAPVNFYGYSKAEAEMILVGSPFPYSIVRPVFMYGRTWEGLRNSFIQFVEQNLRAGKAIRIVEDQQRTPTFVGDVCCGIERIISGKKDGIYHLAGAETLSPYEMAVSVADFLGLDAALVEPVGSSFFKEAAKRPKYSGLKIQKAAEELGYAPVGFLAGLKLSYTE